MENQEEQKVAHPDHPETFTDLSPARREQFASQPETQLLVAHLRDLRSQAVEAALMYCTPAGNPLAGSQEMRVATAAEARVLGIIDRLISEGW
jgi:hypothetical protein